MRWSLTLSPRLGLQWHNLGSLQPHLLGSSDSPASASQVSGITGTQHHAWLIFVFLVEAGFHHVGQAGLKLLTSNDPPSSACQIAGITGMSHRTQCRVLTSERGRQDLTPVLCDSELLLVMSHCPNATQSCASQHHRPSAAPRPATPRY